MDKTKVENMLVEMIAPKLKEIEERFSNGEGLSNDDVNTLLLKSQFNHINHLDMKLNEVTADVSNLRFDMKSLESKFGSLESKIGEMKSELRLEIQTAINKNMQWSIGLITFIVTALKVMDIIWG